MSQVDGLGNLDTTCFEKSEKLPQGAACSGVSWRMRPKSGGSDCVFKIITLPMKNLIEIEKILNAIRVAWLSVGDHPNIATFLGCTYEQSTQQFIIATDFSDGLSLREYMHDGIPIPEQVLFITYPMPATDVMLREQNLCTLLVY
jgi:hypothetical protein